MLAVGGGAAYSTTADLVRYVKALLGGGAGRHASVLQPETLAVMFDSHFPPDPRVPGMGLGFLRGDENRHRTVGHDGIVSGFLSQLTIALEDGIGVVVLGAARERAATPAAVPTRHRAAHRPAATAGDVE